jgi:RNA polymerase sigma-70 factor (ECF subfamily)
MTEEAFTIIYDEHSDAIFRHCFFRLRDRELALDLMQLTFMKAWDHLSKGKELENLKAYLYKIAGNLLIDHYRKKKSTSLDNLMEKGFDPSQDETDARNSQMDAKESLKVLDQLQPPSYQEVIMMRYMSELSIGEISIALKIRENVVSVRLNRALKKLRILLDRHSETPIHES